MDNESTLKFQILVFHIGTLVWAFGWVVGVGLVLLAVLISTIKHGGPITMYRSLKELKSYGV